MMEDLARQQTGIWEITDTLDEILHKVLKIIIGIGAILLALLFIGICAGQIVRYIGKKSIFSNDLMDKPKLENADEFYDKHNDDILKYPSASEREKLGGIVCEEIEITKDQKIDIAVFGIGFVSIYGCGKIRISSFKHVKWKVREAII